MVNPVQRKGTNAIRVNCPSATKHLSHRARDSATSCTARDEKNASAPVGAPASSKSNQFRRCGTARAALARAFKRRANADACAPRHGPITSRASRRCRSSERSSAVVRLRRVATLRMPADARCVTDSSNQRAKAKCVGPTRAHASVFSREPALRSRASPPSLDSTPLSAVAAGPSTTTTMGQSSSNTGHSGESLELLRSRSDTDRVCRSRSRPARPLFSCARARTPVHRTRVHARTHLRTLDMCQPRRGEGDDRPWMIATSDVTTHSDQEPSGLLVGRLCSLQDGRKSPCSPCSFL